MYKSSTSIEINAPAEKVWDALTNPEMVKQYLFGTTVESEWTEGSDVTYTGEWEGKTYEDKGKVLKVEKNKILSSTYWSSMSGTEDKAENYDTVTYELNEENGKTTLTITQETNRGQENADHSASNWKQVLEKMKEILEK